MYASLPQSKGVSLNNYFVTAMANSIEWFIRIRRRLWRLIISGASDGNYAQRAFLIRLHMPSGRKLSELILSGINTYTYRTFSLKSAQCVHPTASILKWKYPTTNKHITYCTFFIRKILVLRLDFDTFVAPSYTHVITL